MIFDIKLVKNDLGYISCAGISHKYKTSIREVIPFGEMVYIVSTYHTNYYYCLNCAEELYKYIKLKLDPKLRAFI